VTTLLPKALDGGDVPLLQLSGDIFEPSVITRNLAVIGNPIKIDSCWCLHRSKQLLALFCRKRC
jgi:hypothetical protein